MTRQSGNFMHGRTFVFFESMRAIYMRCTTRKYVELHFPFDTHHNLPRFFQGQRGQSILHKISALPTPVSNNNTLKLSEEPDG